MSVIPLDCVSFKLEAWDRAPHNSGIKGTVKVHSGFADGYAAVADQVIGAVEEIYRVSETKSSQVGFLVCGREGTVNVQMRSNEFRFDLTSLPPKESFIHSLIDRQTNRPIFLFSSCPQTACSESPDSPPELIVTGHSLAGALATLCAVDLKHKLADQGLFDDASADGSLFNGIKCVTFGCPRVGNKEFTALVNQRSVTR